MKESGETLPILILHTTWATTTDSKEGFGNHPTVDEYWDVKTVVRHFVRFRTFYILLILA